MTAPTDEQFEFIAESLGEALLAIIANGYRRLGTPLPQQPTPERWMPMLVAHVRDDWWPVYRDTAPQPTPYGFMRSLFETILSEETVLMDRMITKHMEDDL
jgi:hypothetical protein